MAAGRVWAWRFLILVSIFSAVVGLPDAEENLGSWYVEIEKNAANDVEVDEGDALRDNASTENESEQEQTASDTNDDSDAESEQEQTASDTNDDSDAESEQEQAASDTNNDSDGEESKAANTESTEGADSTQNEESPELDGTLQDDSELFSTEKGFESQAKYQWILPTTQVVVLSVAAVLAIGLFGTILTTILASEAGRVSLMLAVLGPILSISQRGETGTFTRGRIQGYVEANPGIHFSALRDALNLANGVTAHHLHLLEKEGLIISWLDGSKRRYASSGTDPKLLSKLEQPVVGMQQAILTILADAGNLGIKSGELRAKLETSRQVMSYHMKQLKDRGLVKVDGRGKASSWSLLEAGRAVLQSSQHL